MESPQPQENKSIELDKAVKIGIIIGALIAGLSVAYYLVIYIPKQEQQKMEQQKQTQELKSASEEVLKKQSEPSERALRVAADSYLSFVINNKSRLENFYKTYSNGISDPKTAIKNKAIELDDDTEQLILIESLLEKNKAKVSTQQNDALSTYCRSHFTGDTLNTICF